MQHAMTLTAGFARDQQAAIRASKLFDRARQAADKHRRHAHSTRQLLALSEIQEQYTITGRHYAGIQAVALDDIRGSVNRVTDFDADLYPLTDHIKGRWMSVAAVMASGANLPPVELIKVGDVYFIVDGHHRISAARMIKRDFVDAVVTVWDIDQN